MYHVVGLPFNFVTSVPSKKIPRRANVCLVAYEAHATAQPCRHTNSEAFPTLKGLCDICIYLIAFRMLEVRDHEIALRKLSDGAAQLRTLEGTLLSPIHSLSISRRESQAVAVVVENY